MIHTISVDNAEWALLKKWANGGVVSRVFHKLVLDEAIRRGDRSEEPVVPPADTVAAWLAARCELVALWRQDRVDACRNYRRWCHESGIDPVSDRSFYEALELKNFQPGRSSGMRYHIGLRVKPAEWQDGED